jgi:hypothetical protein
MLFKSLPALRECALLVSHRVPHKSEDALRFSAAL